MNLAELRATLVEWLNGLKQWGGSTQQTWDDYILTDKEWRDRYHPYSEAATSVRQGVLHISIYTDTHAYHISAKLSSGDNDGYLGCTVTNRKWRTGENWHRGNDLPDGPFNKNTFDEIVRAILAFEIIAKPIAVETINKVEQDIPNN